VTCDTTHDLGQHQLPVVWYNYIFVGRWWMEWQLCVGRYYVISNDPLETRNLQAQAEWAPP